MAGSGRFSTQCSQYAQIAADGSRIKVWDAVNGSSLHE